MVRRRERLRAARRARGLSQDELAAQLNVSRVTISQWERGQVEPYPYHVEKLCQFFGIENPAELDLVNITQQDSVHEKGDTRKQDLSSGLNTLNALLEDGQGNSAFCAFLQVMLQAFQEPDGATDLNTRRDFFTTIKGLLGLGLAKDCLSFDPEPWERLTHALVKPASMNLEAFSYFQQFIENGWGLCNAGEWDIAEHILDSFLPDAIRHAPKQRETALLVSQGLVLQSILQTHKTKVACYDSPLSTSCPVCANNGRSHRSVCQFKRFGRCFQV